MPQSIQEKILYQSVPQAIGTPAYWSMVVTTESVLKELKDPNDLDSLPDDAYEGYMNPGYIPRVGDTYFFGRARYSIAEVRWAFDKKFILVILGDAISW